MMAVVVRSALLLLALAAVNGARPSQPACPSKAIEVLPGQSIQSAADKAGEGAAICLKAGTHRLQKVAPLPRQRFYGEPGAILNGAKLLTKFKKEGQFWTADVGKFRESRHGLCKPDNETCNFTNRLFIDNEALKRSVDREGVGPGWFYYDTEAGRVVFADDPAGRLVEFSLFAYAFKSNAANVLIHGVTVEKYANPAQRGAIDAKDASNWTIQNSIARLNAGAGIAVGSGGRIVGSEMHRNGQIGAVLVGKNVVLQGNRITENNRAGFDFTWEAGGVKIAEGENALIDSNAVSRNDGPGLWCDILCRDVTFQNNRVEYNADAGIFHETSYRAVIRNNFVRFNGQALRAWYWGADILIAASENVHVYRNSIATRNEGAAIMLIDQGRTKPNGELHRTSGNLIHDNTIEFSGHGYVGGTTDTDMAHQNAAIIETGGNQFDHNTYKVKPQGQVLFVWGRERWVWDQFRLAGQEKRGNLRFIE
jgi:hypothetical protein